MASDRPRFIHGPIDLGTRGQAYFGKCPSPREREEAYPWLCDRGVVAVWNLQEEASDETLEAERAAFPESIWTPIGDFGTPPDAEAFMQVVRAVAAILDAGRSIYVHCMAGHGRTGLALATLLVHRGVDAERALRTTQRECGGPEMDDQEDFVRSIGAGWSG